MSVKRDEAYMKHIYWLTGPQVGQLGKELEGSGIKMKQAKGVSCTPLNVINAISCVAPKVWDENCDRQGSWYRASNKNGLHLVVSSFDLKEYKDHKAATVTQSDFTPPRLAGLEEKRAMVSDRGVVPHIPQRWSMVGNWEKRILLRWARRLGSDLKDFDLLYLSHTANHANFIKPLFFIRENEALIPYSIDRSAHLCSACLELFQILGEDYPKKLVAPCPGMTIFARLSPDRYLLVEKP